MSSNAEFIIRRRELFIRLEEYFKSKNAQKKYLYFDGKSDQKVEYEISNNEPVVLFNDEQIEKFNKERKSIVIDEKLKDSDEKKRDIYKSNWINAIKSINEAINAGNSYVSLNQATYGLGLIYNTFRASGYSVPNVTYFNIDDLPDDIKRFIESLSEEDKRKLKTSKDGENLYVSINKVAEVFNAKKVGIQLDLDEVKDEEEIKVGYLPNEYLRNFIFFGPPGTGKSYQIKGKAKKIRVEDIDNENSCLRITFHPEYSYYDFVGQYKPVVGSEIISNMVKDYKGNTVKEKPIVYYEFVPGPFTKAIINTLKDKKSNFLLIIEEINRGNCAAIFGDIFQLLDRKVNGESEYSIDIPGEMKKYIIGELKWSEDNWNEEFQSGFKLPANLFIYATMNTSDQSLFPMDSAFKRRWTMEYVPIKFKCEDVTELKNLYLPFPYERIKWLDFIQVINKKIVEFTDTDDKQIGQWFVKKRDDISSKEEIAKEEFIGKVLSYLWFDVFRQQPEDIFKGDIKTFDDINKDNKYNKGIFNEEIEKELGLSKPTSDLSTDGEISKKTETDTTVNVDEGTK